MPKRAHNRPWKAAAQAAARHAAEQRQAARDSRTPQEQLAQLDNRDGKAAKERKRLLKQAAKAAVA